MRLFRRPISTFLVTLHLDGRHPYLTNHDLDFKTQDVEVQIAARGWNDAERQALMIGNLPEHWSRSVKKIARGLPEPPHGR